MQPDNLLFEEQIPGGGMWSGIVRRHTSLKLIDSQGGANVGLMAYNASHPLDRLNLPDTLKAQATARLTRGHILMSDMGRALLSITADTVGWHDPLGGHSNAAHVARQYGTNSYQQARNHWFRNAHENFLIELAKHGLGKRDLVANLNLFSRLDVDASGKMVFHPGNSFADASVELRAEMDVLVVLNTCQHPMDPNPSYAPCPILLQLRKTPPPTSSDYCRTFRSENQRSFTLSERFYAGI